MDQNQFFIDGNPKQEELVKSFVKKFSENPDIDLSGIITRYISYKPETVRAALFVLVDRGLISYDLKELLWNQIEANFDAYNKQIKQYKWEGKNAFLKYVSGYQEEEIYNTLEDPQGIVIDVYHAVLQTAKERELISDEDFNRYYANAKSAGKTEVEIKIEEFSNLFLKDDPAELFESEAEMEAEKEKFWKCPKCNQLVGMELGVCWNCEAEIPEVVEHPDTEEITKEVSLRKTFSPVKSGFYLILAGISMAVLDQWWGYSYYHKDSLLYGSGIHIGGIIFGGIIALVGVFFIGYGLSHRSEFKEPS